MKKYVLGLIALFIVALTLGSAFADECVDCCEGECSPDPADSDPLDVYACTVEVNGDEVFPDSQDRCGRDHGNHKGRDQKVQGPMVVLSEPVAPSRPRDENGIDEDVDPECKRDDNDRRQGGKAGIELEQKRDARNHPEDRLKGNSLRDLAVIQLRQAGHDMRQKSGNPQVSRAVGLLFRRGAHGVHYTTKTGRDFPSEFDGDRS